MVSRSGIKEVEGGSRILIGVREEEAGSNRRKERRWLLEEANEEEERGRERDRECCRGSTWLEIQIRGTACAMHPLIYTRGASSEDCHHMSPLLNGSTPTQLRCFGDCYCDFVFSSPPRVAASVAGFCMPATKVALAFTTIEVVCSSGL